MANSKADLLSKRIELFVIGISTGGPETLRKLIATLTPNFTFPIVIIQHTPENFGNELRQNLQNKNPNIPVKEAHHRALLSAGEIYIAPGGKQLKIFIDPVDNKSLRFKVMDDPPVNDCLPSIDYFLGHAVEICQQNLALIIMTGMGEDGAEGALNVKKHGGIVLVQNPEDSVVSGMPLATIKKVPNYDYKVNIDELSEIINMLK